jgi:hypothetical protein
MKLLFAIPHYYKASSEQGHGSTASRPQARIQALANALLSIHQQFGSAQCEINIQHRRTEPANSLASHQIDIIICTTGMNHILSELPILKNLYQHQTTNVEPLLLGFECHRVLAEHLGNYDYYCFLEDDLIIRDSLFFEKLNQFNRLTQVQDLLHPNRYEVSARPPFYKAYVDGDIRPGATSAFQQVENQPLIQAQLMGLPLQFRRPLNPHSGCFFLNQEQMTYWAHQSHFLDRDVRFVSPLESAATLGIMKTFRVYKPAQAYANFFEIQHFDNRFIQLIGNTVQIEETTPVPV